MRVFCVVLLLVGAVSCTTTRPEGHERDHRLASGPANDGGGDVSGWERRLMDAERALRLGDHEGALESAGTVPPPPEATWRLRWSEVVSASAVATGQYELAYDAWMQRHRMSPDPAREFSQWLRETAGRDTVADWVGSQSSEWIRTSLFQTPWGPDVLLEVATVAASAGQWERVREWATWATQTDAIAEDQLGAWAELLRRAESVLVVDGQALGVLLPLSGPHASAGERALRSLQLALDTFRDSRAGTVGVADAPSSGDASVVPRLVVRDTGGDAATAVEQASSLLAEEHPLGIWGPIGVGESHAVVGALTSERVPIVALASELPPLDGDAPVVTLRSTPDAEALALVRHASVHLGVSRFAVAYVDTAAGQRYVEAYRRAVQVVGGSLAIERAFEPSDTDFRKLAKAVHKSLDARSGRAGRGTDSAGAALFLVARPDVAKRVVAYLQGDGIRLRTRPTDSGAVQLLGPSWWNHPSIVDATSRLTEAAVFTGSFHPDASRGAAEFARQFTERYAAAPSDFEAEAYDSAMLYLQAWGSLGPEELTRSALWLALRERSPFVGIAGTAVFWPGPASGAEPLLLTVDRDAIRQRATPAEEATLRGGS